MKKLIVLMLIMFSSFAKAQEKVIIHINAKFNQSNDWYGLKSLTGVRVFSGYIEDVPELKEKYNVTRVPTIILFYDNKEYKRWEGELDMKVHANLKIVQWDIDHL